MFRFLLMPLSAIYGIAVYIRNKCFDLGILKSTEFDIPIISVGNITVGGTGKTPHVEYLVSLLNEHFKVATLSRGYKRKTKGFKEAAIDSSCSEIGDEPKQIKTKFPDIRVAVMADRVKGINKLCKKSPDLEVIFLDDAYQHRYVKAGLSILLLDYNNPIYEDHLLPYGRLREIASEKRRANIIIITKTPDNLTPIEKRIINKKLSPYPYQNIYFTKVEYLQLKSVFQVKTPYFNILEEKVMVDDILLITGIANPTYLYNFLKKRCKNLQHIKFPDHHAYNKKDIQKITETFNKSNTQSKIIITTEKDSMRLSEVDVDDSLLPYMFYIPMKVKFVHKDADEFNKQIINYVKSNKRHINIPKKEN